MNPVHQAQVASCFRPALPFGVALAEVHVPFDELTAGSYERRVRTTSKTGGMTLVVAETGEGKSATVSSALSIDDGFLPVTVPVSVGHPDGPTPSQISALVLAGITSTPTQLEVRERDAAEAMAHGERPARARVHARFNFGPLSAEVSRLTKPWPVTEREQRDLVVQLLRGIGKYELQPVLVLDDTDKWATTNDRLRAARTFFDHCLERLVELHVPIVANAHPRYFDSGMLEATHFDARVVLPRVDSAGITQILDRRVRIATSDAIGATDLFSPQALQLVCHAYTDSRASIRRVMQIASESLIESDEARLEQVSEGAVRNALVILGPR